MNKSPLMNDNGKHPNAIDVISGTTPSHKSRGSNLSVPHLEPVFSKKTLEKSQNLVNA